MKRKRVFTAVILAAVLLVGCGCSAGSGGNTGDEIENYTRYADYTPEKAEDAGIESGSSGNILVAYFSRSSNTSLSGVDAVSSASLNVEKDGTASGNAQQMAEWIADETGGDLYPIQTMYTYPVDYDQTVDVGEGQNEDNVHPRLINKIDLSSYDVIYLVDPIWHYSLPAPVVSFLEDYDLSGKTICCFTTSGGSGFADTIREIKKAEPDADVKKGITVDQDSISGSEEDVRSAAARMKKKYATGKEKDMSEKETIQIKINDQTFTAELEDNKTAEAFVKKLPLTLRMKELNGNEKYAYNVSLPSDPEDPGNIKTGDLMLFGDDCLVLFYDSFETSYSYTRIGHVTDPKGLADAVGDGSVQITFSEK
jgi:flavodoxin